MAKYSNVVEYNIVTDVDTSGIVKLQNELTKLKQSLKFDKSSFSQLGFDDAKIEKSIHKVNQLQSALTAAFNPKIGTIDLSKLNASLQKEHTSLQMIVKDWEQMGTRGTMAISNLSNALLSMNKGAMNVNTTLSKIANTFSNTVRWGITASIFQEMMSSVQGAVSYMKDLDESLTQIQMVTNSSKENMRELAQYANNAAQALGSTTTDYTNAVKVFVQEGFSESESKQYANLSTKLANVSEQNTATTSDQITAFRNAFQLDYEQTAAAMDKVANVANNTASNVNELMTASQRAASVAQAVGTSQDSFLAAIATIESVTRQSAEEIGNGLKTIYQRFADIKVSGSTEDGVDYGQYANALKSIGVDVLDAAGEFKGMDQILQETQEVWSGLSETMKVAVGEKVAGKFQYNRFAALMNNPEYYQKALNATQGADGMMDQMNDIYMEGIEGRLNTLQAAGEQVMSTLFDQDNVEPIIEQVTELVNGLNNMVEAAGGLNGVVQVLGATMLRTFSTQIAGTISNIATAISTVAANSRNANQLQTTAQLVGLSNYGQVQNENSVTGKLVAGVANNYNSLSDKTQERIRDLSQQIVELEEQKSNILKEQQKYYRKINAGANEEKVLIEQRLSSLGAEIKLLRDKEKAGNITDAELDTLQTLRSERNELAKIYKQYNEIVRVCSEYSKTIAQGKPVTQEMVQQVEKWKQETQDLGLNITELIQLTEQLGIAEGNLNIGESMVEDTIQAANFESRINSVVQTLSSVTSIAFGFSMISDAIKILADDSATLEEKLDAVVMNGLMGLTMLLPGLASLATQMKALTVEFVANTLAVDANTASEVLNTMSLKDRIVMTAAATVELIKNTAATLASAAADAVKAVAAAAAAHPIAAIAIALGAVTIGLAAATKAWIDNYGEVAQATKEYEKQNEILAETKRNYQDVAESLESLNNSLDKISDMRNSLDDMKEGTDEWKEAVRKLNMEILTLIQTYPEIAKYVSNEDGILTLDEKGMDKFYQEQVDKTNHLNDINSIQQVNTLNAKNEQLIAQYAQDHGVSSENIKNALNNSELEITGREDLKASFAELTKSIQSNEATIETLTGTIGTLNTNYENLAGKAEINNDEMLQSLQKKWGYEQFDEYGNSLGYKTDLSAQSNNQNLLASIGEAIGKDVTSGVDTSIFDDTLKVITKDGEEIEHSTEVWMQILANSEEATSAANELFETNKFIYEMLGAEWNEKTKSFTGEVSEDARAALDAYNNDESFKKVLSEVAPQINDVKDFAAAIKAGAINVEGLSEALKKLTPNVEDLTTNINGNTFTNRIDKSSDEDAMKDLLSDSGMSEGAFNRMSRNAYEEEGGYYQQEKKHLEDLIATKKEDGEITDKEAQEISELNLEIEDLDDAAKDTTAMILRMSNGVVKLRSNIDDISEVLTNEAFRGTTEWYQALDDLDKGLSEVLNIDAGTLSDEFIESGDALDYARRMAEGDMSAIDDLRNAAAQDIIQNLTIQTKPGEDVEAIRSQLMAELNQLQADINAGTITVTTDLDTNPFIQRLNEMLAAGQISAEQASQILSSIGMDAKIEHKQEIGKVPQIEYRPTISANAIDVQGLDGNTMFSMPGIKMSPVVTEIDAPVDIPYLVGSHYTGPGVQTANTAARNPSYTGGYSKNPTPKSSSSSPKKSSSPKQPKNNQKKDKQKSEWDYLTDITNDLERQASIIEKLSKLEDRLYGANRVKQLKTLQAEYKKNIKLLQQEEKIAKKHAERLRTKAKDENGNLTINGYAYRAGISQLKFDGQGNLDNGRQIEQGLLAKVNQATKDYNKHRNDDNASYYNQKLDQAKSDYDGFLKAMSDYESTLGKIEDIQSEIQEQKQQIQDGADAIVDSIQEGLEDVLKAMDSQREFDRLYRNWQEGGNDYSHFGNDRMYYSEGLSSLLSPTMDGKSVFNTQLESLNNRVKDAEDVFDINKKDEKDENDEKLSQQAAFENLQEATEHVMDSLNKMVDYYDSLLETIEEASNKMDELIDNRLEQYDRLEDYLGTRLDQLILLFGDKSYEEQSEFYNQKIDVNMQKMVDINTAIKQKQATVDTLMKLEATNKELSSEERKQLQEAKDKVNELQKEQLDTETKLLQDIADKLKTQTSAEMNKLTKDLFNGADIGWLSEQWEIATRNSEKYLDDYNRAFELEKLQLKFQKALNDSQNTSLKTQQKIAALGDEYLTYLREKNKLSEYDVKHAEAQLNILQKQIALEEARDNKSQMQLQRNAAGNYDFVYAADQDAMNQAAEGLLAAQQESYNLSKQMYLDTYNSAYEAALKTRDMVVEIATDASISVEERSERIKFVLDGLNEYLQGSSVELNEISINLYNDFVGAEQLIAEENQGNLSAIFEQMRQETAALMAEINAGINTVKETGTTGLEDFQSTLSTASQGFEGTVSTTIGNVETMVSDSTVNTEEMVSTAVGNITNSIIGEGGFQEALSSAFNQIGEDGSNSFNTMVETITKESDDGHLQKIKVGTINTAEAISKYIDETALKKIDERFVLSRNAVLSQVDEINKKIEEAFEKICGKKDQIGGYLGDFKESSDKALKLAGDSYENFKDKSLKNVEDGLKDLQEETEKWQNDLIDLNQEIQNCASEVSYWKGQIDLAMASTQGLITESNKLQTQLGTLAAQAGTTSGKVDKLTSSAGYAAEAQYNASDAAYDLASNTEDVAGAASSAAGAASGAAGAYRDMAKAAREAAAAAKEAAAQMSAYNNSGFGGSNGGKFGYDNSSNGGDWYWDGYTYQYYGFATGGYTGTWSDHGIDDKSGKLAILHQKELVLNATDTENMLSAVKLVRDIMSGINSIPSLGKLSNQSNFNDTIEQRVEINATFPGVTEVEDIKQALIGLADNAYQYANRYKY